MDVAVAIPILGITVLYWSILIVAIIMGVGVFFNWTDKDISKKRAYALLMITLICVGTVIAIRPMRLSEEQKNLDETLMEVETIKEQFAEEKHFIKEMQQKDSYEVEGQIGGVFLLIAGGMYGQFDGSEMKKITLIYKKNNTQRHYVKTLLMEKCSIETTKEGNMPYFAYSDAYYIKDRNEFNKFTVKSGQPVLYLPYGWEIFGAQKNFA